MDYKVGDKVVIKPWGLMEREYGLAKGGSISWPCRFGRDIEYSLAGTDRAVVIDAWDGSDGTLLVVLPNGQSRWAPVNAILGYAFEWGEEIEVSDDGQSWVMGQFRNFRPGLRYPVLAGACPFKFARPIRKPEIEITVKINGKTASLKDISEETLKAIRNM